MSELIQKHGGYRKLKSFQVAQLVYDVTVRFCDRSVDRRSRTHDQMVQAARSGVQNIAEGSQASATAKKTELKLTQVARASLEELKLDYEDFLRQRGLAQWERENPLRQALIDRRCQTAQEVAAWVREAARGSSEGRGQSGQGGSAASGAEASTKSTPSTLSAKSTQTYPEFSAKAALALAAGAFTTLRFGYMVFGIDPLGLTKSYESGATVTPVIGEVNSHSQRNACLANLKQIQAAREQVMMSGIADPKPSDIYGPSSYILVEPVCPSTKQPYKLGIGFEGIPQCLSGLPGHALPSEP